jgi:hypothetical protein
VGEFACLTEESARLALIMAGKLMSGNRVYQALAVYCLPYSPCTEAQH